MKTTITTLEIRSALTTPAARIAIQIALALLIRYLRTLTHPTARIAYRLAQALTVVERATDIQSWMNQELPKIERELRKLSKTHTELEYVLVGVRKFRTALKG